MRAPKHISILGPEITDALTEHLPLLTQSVGAQKLWIIDCTFGGGGHTQLLLDRIVALGISDRVSVLGLDRDPNAIARGHERFAAALQGGRLRLLHLPFSSLPEVVKELSVVGILADLGFSSDQMDDPLRGLSFNADGPLDMRLDPSQGPTCRELLTHSSETEIARFLYEYGEERLSRRIAARIVQARRAGHLPNTPRELASLIVSAMPASARHGRIHAATRSFQGLRIAVNQELDELDSLLSRGILSLEPGGRVAILSFHSLEDRKVKQVLKAKESGFKPLTKKPIEPGPAEIASNPRARSAKLRVAEKSA